MNALTKTIVIVVAGSLLCIAAAFWLVIPGLGKVDELNKDLLAQKSEIASLKQQISAYKTAESDLNKATDKDRILDAILLKENLVEVIKQTESAIAKSGTEEQRLSIDDPFLAAATGQPQTKNPKDSKVVIAGLNGVVNVPYELSLKNDYAGVLDLFSYLEHLPNFTEISSFQLTAETANSGSTLENKPAAHTGSINLNINAIYFVKKDAITKN